MTGKNQFKGISQGIPVDCITSVARLPVFGMGFSTSWNMILMHLRCLLQYDKKNCGNRVKSIKRNSSRLY